MSMKMSLTVMDQIIYTRMQINFQIMRNCNGKLSMNTKANKLYHLNNKIGLNMLNNGFVHFEKLTKSYFWKMKLFDSRV